MNERNDDLLIRVSRRAMASEFEVCFPANRCENGTELALEALDRVEAVEEQLSFFRPTSTLSEINRKAGAEPLEIEPGLFDLLCLARRIHAATEGAYDITSAPLWEAWGFARRQGEIPSEAALAEARSCVGSDFIELNTADRTIRFRKPGVRINLGSIGKGYALDCCAERLLALGMSDFLVHGGQSSVVAHGSPRPLGCAGSGGPPPRWEIGVPDPRRPGHRMGIFRLSHRALGTSGGQFQSFRHRGRRLSHVIDPRSGWPAEGVLSVTVLAASAAEADALSTAFYVMGPERAMAFCEKHPEIGMLMTCPDSEGQRVVRPIGLSEGEWLPSPSQAY